MEVEEDEIESHHPSLSQSPSPSRSQSPTSSQSPPPQSPNHPQSPPPPHSPPSQQQAEPPLSPSPISSIQPHQNQKQEPQEEHEDEEEDVEDEEEQALTEPTSPPEEAAQTLTLALPIQPPPIQTSTPTPAAIHHSHGREDCWSEGATSMLIDAWGERYLELSRGNLKQKHWKDVADIVTGRDDYSKSSKTDVQCKNRIDTLKKKYKIEKNKMAESGFSSKWSFFERLDLLIGPNSLAAKNVNTPSSSAPAPLQFQHLSGGGGGSGSGGGGGGGVGGKVPLAVPVHLVGRYDHASQTLNLNLNHHQQQQQQHYQQQRPQRGQPEKTTKYMIESDESSGEPVYDDDSPDSTDSLPPETDYVRKRPRLFARRACPNPSANSVPVRGGRGGGGGGGSYRGRARSSGKKRSLSSSGGGGSSNWKSSIMELTKAIAKFGEAYEQIETSKLQQVVEMEQQRMEFMKELELQRMQFFMKTQVDLSQVKQGRRGGNSRRHNNNNNSNNHNNNINNGDDNSG